MKRVSCEETEWVRAAAGGLTGRATERVVASKAAARFVNAIAQNASQKRMPS
jgi:hypothetical protein